MAPFFIPYPKRTTPKFLADKTQASRGVEDMDLAYIFLSWWLWVDLASGVNLAGPVGRTSSAQQLLFLRRLCPSCCVGWSSGWPEPRLVQQNLLLSLASLHCHLLPSRYEALKQGTKLAF